MRLHNPDVLLFVVVVVALALTLPTSAIKRQREIPAYVKLYDLDSSAPIYEWEETPDGAGHFVFTDGDFGDAFSFLEAGSQVQGDPQNLAPQALQCYCKFEKPKIETVPASAFNNEKSVADELDKEGEPAEGDTEEGEFVETGESDEHRRREHVAHRPQKYDVVYDDEFGEDDTLLEESEDTRRHLRSNRAPRREVRHHRVYREHTPERHHRRRYEEDSYDEDRYETDFIEEDEDRRLPPRHRYREPERRHRRRYEEESRYDDDDGYYNRRRDDYYDR